MKKGEIQLAPIRRVSIESRSYSFEFEGYQTKSQVSKNKGGIWCYVRNDIHSQKITDFDDLYEEMKVEFYK